MVVVTIMAIMVVVVDMGLGTVWEARDDHSLPHMGQGEAVVLLDELGVQTRTCCQTMDCAWALEEITVVTAWGHRASLQQRAQSFSPCASRRWAELWAL